MINVNVSGVSWLQITSNCPIDLETIPGMKVDEKTESFLNL